MLVFSFPLVTLELTFETEFRGTDIQEIELGRGLVARKATLGFRDGSAVTFDLPRVHESKAFVRRWERTEADRR